MGCKWGKGCADKVPVTEERIDKTTLSVGEESWQDPSTDHPDSGSKPACL